MPNGTTSKIIDRTLNRTFDGIQWAIPHVINAHQTITRKVIYPAGLTMLSGVATVAAKVVTFKTGNTPTK